MTQAQRVVNKSLRLAQAANMRREVQRFAAELAGRFSSARGGGKRRRRQPNFDTGNPARLNSLSSRRPDNVADINLEVVGFIAVTSFGRVISVRGSLARVGLLATSNMPVSEVRATVGRFVSIRCASSIIVAMVTEVSCENLPTADNYIAIASVD